jgi:hypothetical protein
MILMTDRNDMDSVILDMKNRISIRALAVILIVNSMATRPAVNLGRL